MNSWHSGSLNSISLPFLSVLSAEYRESNSSLRAVGQKSELNPSLSGQTTQDGWTEPVAKSENT